MINLNELEEKIKQSKDGYSLFADDGKKTYSIFSDELKQSIRGIIHDTARAGE